MRTQVPINVPAWWLIIMPVLLILLIGIVVLIVINIVNTKQKNTKGKGEETEKKNSKDKTLTSWIKKKDLLYWLLIICLGTISLFTFRYKDATEVISHWGFAGTIVSIILAIVAIGFTLFQTLSSNLSSEKISVSADKIEQATQNLDSDTLSESSKIMIEAADFLKTRISLIEDKLTSINNAQEAINEMAATGFREMNNVTEKVDETLDIINIDTFYEDIFLNLPYLPQLFVYINLNMINNNIKLNADSRNIMLKELTDFRLQNDNINSSEDFFRGANAGSNGATRSFLNYLGITNKFEKLSNAEQKTFLEKLKEHIRENHVLFIDNLVDNFFNN